MDYHRIYRDFIASRRLIEGSIEGYAERHHILPRALGGNDDPNNLILLTVEDHFFAHLLLAKMHGRGMWAAVRRMRWGRVDGERVWLRGRYMYAIARKEQARFASESQKGRPGKSGAENSRFDHAIRSWTNLDSGEVVESTTSGMWERFGGCRPHWTSAVSGARKSMKGWTVSPDAIRVRSVKGQVFDFVNRDGRTFSGTQTEFCRSFGVNPASASRLVKAESVTQCGWRRKGTLDRPANCGKDGLPNNSRRRTA